MDVNSKKKATKMVVMDSNQRGKKCNWRFRKIGKRGLRIRQGVEVNEIPHLCVRLRRRTDSNNDRNIINSKQSHGVVDMLCVRQVKNLSPEMT